MSTAYWAQWSCSEIMSMHGVDLDECHDDDDEDYDCDTEEHEGDEDSCPRCTGCGCNYCLMCSY